MSKSGHEALAEALRTTPPAGVAVLTDEQQATLAGMLRAARAEQGRELEASLLAAADHLPRPLRGPLRKMFGL